MPDGDMKVGAPALTSHPADRVSDLTVDELRALLRPKPSIFMSPEVGDLMRALAAAQGKMVNPRRDREVTVQPRNNGRPYTFRYSTLGVINDMIREPLAEAGIARTNQHYYLDGKPGILTRLWLGEQFIGSWLPMILGEQASAQNMGSASSYCERYNIKGLCALASDDDDDANAASGNSAVFTSEAATANMTDEQRLEFYRQRLMKFCRNVRLDQRDTAVTLLKMWQDRIHLLATLREAQPAHYSQMLDQVYGALMTGFGTTFGPHIAWAWQATAAADTFDKLQDVKAEYHEKHKQPLAELKRETPQAIALLAEHMRFFQAGVEKAEEERIRREQADEDMRREIEAIEIRSEQRKLVVPEGDLLGEPVERQQIERAPPREYILTDYTGELAGDATSDPAAFARAYVNQWQSTPRDGRQALLEFNEEALAWVGTHRAAAAILEEAVERAAPVPAPANIGGAHDLPSMAVGQLKQPSAWDTANALDGDDIPTWDDAPLRIVQAVAVPQNRHGKPDLATYVQHVQSSLEGVCDVPTMKAWEVANSVVYGAPGFPISAKTHCLKAVIARKRLLGMPLGEV